MDSNGDGQALQRIEEKIVIVGGGIGGLACALALHRYNYFRTKFASRIKLRSKTDER